MTTYQYASLGNNLLRSHQSASYADQVQNVGRPTLMAKKPIVVISYSYHSVVPIVTNYFYHY